MHNTMERGFVHACHVQQIDVAWTAALAHGFKPV